MNRLRRELDVFLDCPRSMRVLLLANSIYALVLPVIEIFVAAYVMRNSHDVAKVVAYQLAVYAATPVAFFLNGMLLSRVGAKHLYAAGMVLSGLALLMLMRTTALTTTGIAVLGLALGLATGLFWANRGLLALDATGDSNRNYFYGVETFAGAMAAVVVPALVGWFIGGAAHYGWAGGIPDRAYRWVAIAALGLTVAAALLLERGEFGISAPARLLFLDFHPLWRGMLQLAVLKGLAQGYMLTAPAMLILLLVGQEATLGLVQAMGGVFSACVLYTAGRMAAPHNRPAVFAAALLLFFFGAAANAVFFGAAGVLVFIGCLVLAKPLLDLAYNPIELRVVNVLSGRDGRSAYAYLFNHEFGLFTGRSLGCILFLAIVEWGSAVAALKYAPLIVALVQLLSIPVAADMARRLKLGEPGART